MKKSKNLKTVVNKSQDIQNPFRVLDFELLAGEPDYIVVHVCQWNCNVVDFAHCQLA
jgi:tRNA G37 N-methylase Trm5